MKGLDIGAQEIDLEEDLILGIWTGIDTIKNAETDQMNKYAKPTIDIEMMLKIYPISTSSYSPFIKSLIDDIYEAVRSLSTFWPIKIKNFSAETKSDQPRFRQYFEFAKKDIKVHALSMEAV